MEVEEEFLGRFSIISQRQSFSFYYFQSVVKLPNSKNDKCENGHAIQRKVYLVFLICSGLFLVFLGISWLAIGLNWLINTLGIIFGE